MASFRKPAAATIEELGVDMGAPSSGVDAGSWLAGVYELNAVGQAWAGFSVLADATVRFATRQEACSALGIAVDGDSYTSRDPAVVQRARDLIQPVLINSTHRPGQLVLFVLHAAHLDGTGLMTYEASDSDRSISTMTQALTPAPDAELARARLLEAVEAASAHPGRDEVENFLETRFGIAPDSPDPEAARAVADLEKLADEFRGHWYAFVGNTRIGVFHADCWTPPSPAGSRTGHRPTFGGKWTVSARERAARAIALITGGRGSGGPPVYTRGRNP